MTRVVPTHWWCVMLRRTSLVVAVALAASIVATSSARAEEPKTLPRPDGNPGREGFGLKIAEAQLAIADEKKHPEFKGNVKAVDTRDLWREAADSPSNQGYHYNHNAETYTETGLRLG